MIEQLDQVLRTILNDTHAPEELQNAEVSFDIPKEGYAPDRETINLYLYNIQENRILRNPEPIIEIDEGNYYKQAPPVRVDCFYMLTAWNSRTGEHASAHEHKLLSESFRWLSKFSQMPNDYFPEEWKDKDNTSYQPHPVYISTGQMDTIEEPGKFWAALGSPPRPFVNIKITISMCHKETKEIGPPVLDRVIKTGQKSEDQQTLKTETEEEYQK